MAQEGEKLSEYCKNFNYKTLVTGLNDYQEKSTEKIKFKWSNYTDREIVNHYFEQVIKFEKMVQNTENKNSYSVERYKIKLIKDKEGDLAYYKITQIKHVQSNGHWVQNEILISENSNKRLEQVKSDYKKLYAQSLNFNQLFETEITYGNHCGIAGTAPEYRVKLEELIAQKDTAQLVQWLKSATIEIQLYAIDGILTLKDEGVNFNPEVYELIDSIEKKEGTAFTCSGCIHWNEPINEIVIKIKKEHSAL